MLRPSQVKFYSKKAERKNLEFRSWLKMNVDPEDLDLQFKLLHEELFASYNCSRCRNCCKAFAGCIPTADIERDAEYLHMSVEDFREKYLESTPTDNDGAEGFMTKHKPCDFLGVDGECILGDCRPQNCVDYPFTDKPDRMGSLYSFLDAVSVCPVAYEICERLKAHYRFR